MSYSCEFDSARWARGTLPVAEPEPQPVKAAPSQAYGMPGPGPPGPGDLLVDGFRSRFWSPGPPPGSLADLTVGEPPARRPAPPGPGDTGTPHSSQPGLHGPGVAARPLQAGGVWIGWVCWESDSDVPGPGPAADSEAPGRSPGTGPADSGWPMLAPAPWRFDSPIRVGGPACSAGGPAGAGQLDRRCRRRDGSESAAKLPVHHDTRDRACDRRAVTDSDDDWSRWPLLNAAPVESYRAEPARALRRDHPRQVRTSRSGTMFFLYLN
jgi:hypothetical protein